MFKFRHTLAAPALAALALTAVGGAGLFASRAFALDGRVGTIGSEFTATFTGDLGKKPKIELRYLDPMAKQPKAKAKVTAANGGQITFVIQAAKGGGTFEIGVKGSDETAGTLRLRAPRIDSAGGATVAAGAELVLNGAFFGESASKRNAPKVFVNGKKAKTRAFDGNSITIQVHKKTAPGLADITVQNKIGEGVYNGVVTVTAPPKPIKGADSLSAKIGGKSFKAKFTKKKPEAAFAVFNAPLGTLQISAAKNAGSPRNLTTELFVIALNIGVNDFDNLTLPATFGRVGLVTFTRTNIKSSGGIPPKITQTTTMWTNEGGTPFQITIDGWDGQRFSCSFSGTLNKAAGDGAASIKVEAGSGVLEARQ